MSKLRMDLLLRKYKYLRRFVENVVENVRYPTYSVHCVGEK